MIVVHVTHEAVEKIGGIGAVIAGLVTTDTYDKTVSRTILLGPLLKTDSPVNRRLGDGGKIIYSSLDAITPPPWREKFHPIEKTYDVGIIYGTRNVSEPCGGRTVEVEVLVLDVFHANPDRLNLFKSELFKKFGVPSDRFEKIWEYEQYVRLAEPGYEALKAIGANGGQQQRVVLLAHEYMGMPTALKTILAGSPNTRTVFYAHEVASVRPIVEDMPGHDTMFYNVIEPAAGEGRTVEDLFPSVFANFKHPLVKAARYCDHVFAVGDYIERELRFLDPHFQRSHIDLVYNGIPAVATTPRDKQLSRARMQQYAGNLFGEKPDWIFTHVCRPVVSKAIWRDLRVLHEMEPLLAERGETAVYFMLGTLAGQRRPQDVRQMEKVYGWPVRHERGYPDLCGGEEALGVCVDGFNKDHRAIRAVLVNQWDWNAQVCGQRMPVEMVFADVRRGTDVEFGLSVYEPFGISQFEPLCCGAICVPSNVCGCMGFARKVRDAGVEISENIVEGDFLVLPGEMSVEQLLNMPLSTRDEIETGEARRLAAEIFRLLPRDESARARRIERGFDLAQRMSWEHVVQEYFLPSLGRAAWQA
ncbi:MAG TPA: hypothetical protein DCX07_11290 [Phycisphaerales bacterium]|nr:hypothetical protein [Phycisphaerales bacterium]